MENHKCEYCNKTFKSSKSLNIHVENTKACLKVRGLINSNFQCNICEKKFSTKQNLELHSHKCNQRNLIIEDKYKIILETVTIENEKIKSEYSILKEEKEKLIIQLEFLKVRVQQLEFDKNELKDYKERYMNHCANLEKLQLEREQLYCAQSKQDHDLVIQKASSGSSNTVTNNTMNAKTIKNQMIQNMNPISRDILSAKMAQNLPSLDIKSYLNVSKLISTAIDIFEKDVLCTDKSRYNVTYKDGEGNTVQDQGCTRLAKIFFSIIKETSEDLILKKVTEIYQDDNKRRDKDYYNLASELSDQRLAIIEASSASNSLSQKFARDICKICQFIGVTPLQIEEG